MHPSLPVAQLVFISRLLAGLLLLTVTSVVQAHSPGQTSEHLWSLDPWVLVPLIVSFVWYGYGLLRYWRKAGIARGIGYGRVAAFLSGMLALFLALIWPFEALSSASFAAHMVQHLLLIVVAPPLLVLAKPWPLYLAALPRSWRQPLLRRFQRNLSGFWRRLVSPGVAFSLHALAVWIWHAPGAFNAALASNWVHILEHACFFVTALLFWWSVVNPALARGKGYGLSAFWVLSTLMHSGFLGALLTFAPRPLYAAYVESSMVGQLLWGMTALEDQQLAGVVMWVPAGLIYLVAGLVLISLWLRRLERQPVAMDLVHQQAVQRRSL